MSTIKNKFQIMQQGKPSNQTIIFIHGFPYDSLMWKDQIEYLKEKYYCISYDLRGLGKSPVGGGQYTMEMFVDDLEQIIFSQELNEPIICGLSMGGYIALRALERMEVKFKGAILCDTKSAADDNAGKLKRADAIKKINEEGGEAFVSGFVRNCFTEKFLATEKFEEVLKRSLTADPVGLKGCILAMAARTDTTDYLKKISIPVLILCGEMDKLTPPDVMKEMHERIKNSEFYTVPDAAHMTPIENPGFVNEKIKTFLEKNF
jgi:3-oxoadipate enol-lactonase